MNQQTTRPQTATEILHTAGQTLGERGKQYDPNGKQERSMTAICAAFNAIYPASQLTVHMGWQFMSLVKMVRGATKPHADSALDQVAYAALAAEEVASQLQEAQSSKLGSTLQEALCEDEGCMHHGTPHVCITSVETAEQHKARCAEQHEAEVDRLKAIIATQDARLHNLQLAHKAQVIELVAELDTTHAALSDFVCRFDLTKEYMTKEQVLAGQAKHEAQLADYEETIRELQDKLLARNTLISEKNQDLGVRVARIAMLEQELQEVYRTNANLRGELETVRGECLSRGAQLAELAAIHARDLKSVECLRKICYIASTFPSQVHAVVQEVITSYGYGYFYQASEANWKGQPESPVAHNTDEPKAAPAMAPYVDPYDSYGDVQPKPLPRTVGSADPARCGLAYPQGKPLEPL